MWALLRLMSDTGVVSLECTCSVLGYSLLPMVMLSSVAILFNLQDMVGLALTITSVLWCTMSATKVFVNVLQLPERKLLVAYPCALVYGVFALMIVY